MSVEAGRATGRRDWDVRFEADEVTAESTWIERFAS